MSIEPPKPPKIVVETAETVDPRFSFLLAVRAHAAIASFDGEKKISLDLMLEDGAGEQRRYVIELGAPIDPYLLAADLQACGDHVLRRSAIDAGLDEIETQKTLREAHRVQRIARRQLLDGFDGEPSSTCQFCPRSTAFVIDGVRYCKRCAEEHGVRPRGKIGGEES